MSRVPADLQTLTLPDTVFFEGDGLAPVREWVLAALRGRHKLGLASGHGVVHLSVLPADVSNTQMLELSAPIGFSPFVAAGGQTTARFLLPFLLPVHSLALPSSSLVYFGREGCSVADFVVHNLFWHLARGAPVQVTLLGSASPQADQPGFDNRLRQQYLLRLHHHFPEDVLQSSTALQTLALAVADAVVVDFEAPMLQAELLALQAVARQNAAEGMREEMVKLLLNARPALMQDCYDIRV